MPFDRSTSPMHSCDFCVCVPGGNQRRASSVCTSRHRSRSHWGYSGADGPSHWGDLDPSFATCKTGKRQSPIDTKDAKKAPSLAPV